MPIPAVSRARITISGSIGGGGHWACTLWGQTDNAGLVNQGDIQTCADTIRGFVGTLWSGALVAVNPPPTTLQFVELDYFLPGSQAVAGKATGTGITLIGTNNSWGPASQALVVTHHTAFPGRSGRGRVYLPWTSGLEPDGGEYNFHETSVDAIQQAWKDLLVSLKGHAFPGFLSFAPSVQSMTLGQLHPITSISADARPDRQERRESGLSFSRFASVIP